MAICENANAKAIVENNWQIPSALEEETEFIRIQQMLFALCDPLEQEGKSELAQSVALVAHVAGMILQFVDPKVPFRESSIYGGSRTLNLSDLTTDHLEVLKVVENRCSNLFLKARINDVLWIKVRPFDRAFAEAAVKVYLQLALKISAEKEKLFYAKNYTSRAINIWRELGSQDVMQKEIEDVLIKCMTLDKAEPLDATRIFFFENLANCFNTADTDKWISTLDGLIQESKDQKEFEKARKYTIIQRRFYQSKKDRDSIAKSKRSEVEIFIEEAKEKKLSGASSSIVQHFINKAYEAARNTPGMAAEAKMLKSEMIDVQTGIPESFKEFSTAVTDLRPEIESIQSKMQDKKTEDCIKMIAEVMIPYAKKELYTKADTYLKENPIQAFLTMGFLDEKGKLIARRPGIGSSQEERTAALRAEATQFIRHAVSLRGTILTWMRREICNRPDTDEKTFDFLLYPNPFVPASRILQYRQGLQRGLSGDWISSLSILVPQLENSFRTILHLSGADVISIDSDGIQQEKDLNSFIYGDDFEAIFGEDMAFTLQVLLTDKIGFGKFQERCRLSVS